MRSLYFDVLKGVAIIAVVLYHLGVSEYGYLGVDIFLVFAGYITMSSVHCSTNSKFLIIGEKNFGECNGQVYMKRFSDDYYNQFVNMQPGYASKNKILKQLYPNNYVDLIEGVCNTEGKVRVFTDDGHFISQDCRHLTQAGAKFYANLINWNLFLSRHIKIICPNYFK